MQLPTDRWYSAIESRYSTRAYNWQMVEKEKLGQISKVCAEFSMPGARAILTSEGIEKVFKGAIGPYGKVKGAPAYVAFVGDMDDENVQEKVGYIGEGVVLEATALSLATCWVGGFFHPKAVAKSIRLNPNECALAVTPIGYPKEDQSVEERIMHGIARSHTRKELSQLASRLPQEEWPWWVQIALEAARIAPSAVNRQPWRFLVRKKSITVLTDTLTDTRISKRLDCGIAMLHIELGARRAGVDGSWEYLSAPEIARFVMK